MISYKTIYLICIILCLMGYTDSAPTTEDQQLCKQNIQDDFDCPAKLVIKSDKLILPRKAFKNKVLSKFQTPHGVGYLMKIIEKAAPGITDCPRDFCNRTGRNKVFPSTLCMEQLHEVYHFTNEKDALPVIKWTYVNKSESDIPKKFNFTIEDGEVLEFKHFAYAYFKHMLSHIDAYVSLPRAVAFCRHHEPYYGDKDQLYLNITYENPEGSNTGEMTVKELHRNKYNKRSRKNSEPDTLPSNVD